MIPVIKRCQRRSCNRCTALQGSEKRLAACLTVSLIQMTDRYVKTEDLNLLSFHYKRALSRRILISVGC